MPTNMSSLLQLAVWDFSMNSMILFTLWYKKKRTTQIAAETSDEVNSDFIWFPNACEQSTTNLIDKYQAGNPSECTVGMVPASESSGYQPSEMWQNLSSSHL